MTLEEIKEIIFNEKRFLEEKHKKDDGNLIKSVWIPLSEHSSSLIFLSQQSFKRKKKQGEK